MVILLIKTTEPRRINLEEDQTLLRHLHWTLRSRNIFRHRIVVLLDSKIAICAVMQDRLSASGLNAFLRRLATLCFAGGPGAMRLRGHQPESYGLTLARGSCDLDN